MIITAREKGKETMNKISGNTSVVEIVKSCPNARRIFGFSFAIVTKVIAHCCRFDSVAM